MDMQGALRARLIADAGVSALVGQRVYWMERPQGASLPAIVLQVISEDRPQHMKGFTGLDWARVQIDAWGLSYGDARGAAEAVIAAITPEQTGNGVRFTRSFVDIVRDSTERVDTKTIFRTTLDMMIHHAAQ